MALVPLFFGGLYFAARTGIAIADRQAPPGSVLAPFEVMAGSRWLIASEGLIIAADAESLREYDFRQAGSGGTRVEGVELLDAASVGWELQIMPDGDRRYLKSKFLSGDLQGDEMWVLAKQLTVLAKPAVAAVE